MQAKFLHLADSHLGYQQYNSTARYNDFARAFLAIIDAAIAEQVDFAILAGDLFQKRTVNARTLNQAIAGLERLHKAGIPCLAVEGNHEKPYYQDQVGWMTFLAQRELIVLLDAPFEEGVPQLTPYQKRRGAYIDPVPGLRVYGLKYFGAGTAKAVASYAEAIAAQPDRDAVDYTVFITHAGVEGVIAGQSGGLSTREWSVLQPHVDYLALGHVHKPFEFDNWIYNPGSAETCSTMEAQWTDRGYYLVDVDTSRANAESDDPKHSATLHPNPRRPFHRLSVKVDLHTTPEALYDFSREYIQRKARDLAPRKAAKKSPAPSQPVVDLRLDGTLAFDRTALDLGELDSMIREAFDPLHVQVRNLARATEFEIEAEAGFSRPQLERQVITELLERDARFRKQSEQWADVALSLKNLALGGADASALLTELEDSLETLAQP